MKVLDLFGIDLYQFFDHIGVADTQVLVEDTTDESIYSVSKFRVYFLVSTGRA